MQNLYKNENEKEKDKEEKFLEYRMHHRIILHYLTVIWVKS